MAGKLLVKNRRARFDFEVLEEFEAGMVLSGGEVKSLRAGHANLTGSHVQLMSGEAWLINAQINPYQFADNRDYDPKRRRKLLLHKHELENLAGLSAVKGRTLVPLAIIARGNTVKLEFGVARGKKLHDKRRDLKDKAQKRDMQREMKGRW